MYFLSVCNCIALVFIAGIVWFSSWGTFVHFRFPVSPVDVHSFDETVIRLNVSLFSDLGEKSSVLLKFASVCICSSLKTLMLPICILNMYNE